MTVPRSSADIVERLRARAKAAREENTGTALGDAIHFEEAATEIERLEFEYERADQSAKRLGAKWKEAVEGSGAGAQTETGPDTDCEMAFIEACDEAGCAYDNEALLQAIADLKRPILEYEFPYQQTFEAIAAATEIYPSKEQAIGLSISVKKFQEAFNSHRDKRPLTALALPSTDEKWSFPGCRDRDSCHRHGECMYVGCPHNIARLSTLSATDRGSK